MSASRRQGRDPCQRRFAPGSSEGIQSNVRQRCLCRRNDDGGHGWLERDSKNVLMFRTSSTQVYPVIDSDLLKPLGEIRSDQRFFVRARLFKKTETADENADCRAAGIDGSA